uniref:Uncharacterized protein n=1 Tax=Tanacetum cinerariifolium TaxID=118510 RepID=A0A699J5S1_TANCI|nr:hypothetical protein [Tanacetum cinerariifolium]
MCLETSNHQSASWKYDIRNASVFREIHLPESIKLGKLSISKLRETLVVLEYNMVVASGMPLCAVWMMDNDSFTQLYTIKAPAPSFNAILGFRKTGAIIFKRRVYNHNKSLLATYEPDSKQIAEIGVFDSECSFSVHSYKETQLLIDQPDGPNTDTDKEGTCSVNTCRELISNVIEVPKCVATFNYNVAEDEETVED